MTDISSDVTQSNSSEIGLVRRLHPLSLATRFLSRLPQLVYIVPALLFGSFSDKAVYIVPFFLAVLSLMLVASWLQWSRFSYQIDSEEIRIKSGVMMRNNRSIPFERIQDVNVEQKLLLRLFGLATVKLETGGSGGNEGKFNALLLTDAEDLRDLIRDRKAALASGENEETASDVAEKEPAPLYFMDQRRLLIAGLFNFSFILLAVFGAITQNANFLIPDEFLNPLYWLKGLADQQLLDSLNILSRIFGILAIAFSLFVVGTVSGLVATYIREYGFTLDRVDNGFRRRRGLFTLTDVVMPLHRVQAAILRTGPVRRYFGWYHLKFQSLASDGKNDSDHSVAPLANMSEVRSIVSETGIITDASRSEYRGVDGAMWWVPSVILTPLIAIAVSVPAIVISPWIFGGLLGLVLLPTIWYFHWKYHEYLIATDQLFVRSGFWLQKLTVLPIRKIQSVDVAQSLLDHPLGLATLVVGTAGGSAMSPLKITSLPYKTALELREKLFLER